ncbi:uncharacterized protein LOC9649146 [Selaginella moellendorffii]|uniref:uncharacterized protein LOC9649146 n=1 Tax=Selaginella moellendorffii TaxID=88036 RepID=UPI000D1C258F|nr:uncharacterized protein LOC9649146 [Selaginella moellendorffii]|eukprot:XP_024537327.1 uncharacterized protein LOC9649146 [Selaginella moellendorffii]
MDLLFEKARDLAQETAKKSQDFAKEAAKFSQELALETAKKSKELAVEATKRADQIKAFATAELSPGSVTPPSPSQEELETYGITPELREFVKTFTIRTFRDYDTKDLNETGVRQDLSEWQEKHAVFLLQVVPDLSDFRYVLCPRRMKETTFWKIYFKLVENYIAPYEARANIAKVDDQTSSTKPDQPREESSSDAIDKKPHPADHDLDAYLLGALDGHDDGQGDDGDSDPEDFDRLVNSTGLDSDGEDGVHKSEAAGSSDGELVEIPDSAKAQSEHCK